MCGVGAVSVVVAEPRGHGGGTLMGRGVGAGIEPLSQCRLDEALGLAVGAGCVGGPDGVDGLRYGIAVPG